ncbi:PTS sugar transporter subunit IIB [Brachyspira aalborgi]|jgi:PTS system cellobiose-specific IIB component|uniref:PTS sugar transporter subunit IIB n=1 Tax=Brachyspira aalborgi TaxID=29522 RepID=A0A5C8DFC7_9SPIR|nr:PTS sugar transporter subunit IIB [Brachyspira aalborgi]CCY78571.1 phosphotransferase system lactose/cellobiose-specific IIB subunit [Brachyspira sp. CAG:700]TXJ24217.1 PTS sugar transporter subunit IIB [Brachyspira aalborgi]TXJ36142.1 PTS sugar transporter subunit IIB [Brachyspira aalborgi]TXJ36503.1 PTS sugar transporter subunit IIB [Brachyspira aalborgi]TXJ45486.1 PTS sugar transporter subunit IIB [Brachyspira aalborgi]
MKKILLLCSAGMSTSMLVKKMKESAEKRNIEAEIEAVSTARFYELLDSYDIFLLGPQVKYQKAELQAKAKEKNKPLDVIDFKDYGMMNGEKILDFALNLKVE